MTLVAGQKLVYVCEYGGYKRESEPREVTVESVGRRWANLSWRGYRCDKNTLIVDGHGYSSPGRCHLSIEHYQQWLAAGTAWRRLSAQIGRQYACPTDVTAEDIAKAAELLGLDLEKA